MQKFSAMLKDCAVEAVLGELAAGMPSVRRSFMLKRYYSVYCMLLEEWRPGGKHDVILTDFREGKRRSRGAGNQFYGIGDYRKAAFRGGTLLDPAQVIKSGRKRVKEIDWEKIIRPEADVEVLIPDCLLEAAGDIELTALIVRRIERVCSGNVSVRGNRKLMDRVNREIPFLPGRNAVLERTVKHRLLQRVSPEDLIDEIREYAELTGEVMQWAGLLGSAETCHYTLLESEWDDDDTPMISEKVIRCLFRLDPDNPPKADRVMKKVRELNMQFRHLELSEFQKAQQKRQRIVIEPNPSAGKLPLICVRSRGGTESRVEDVALSELLCMDIHVLDKSCTGKEQVLALLLFNLLYPIRMMRLQK